MCFPDITAVFISTSLIPIHPGTWRSGSATTFRAAESVSLATVFCTAKIKECQFSRTQSKWIFPQILPFAAVCATFTSFLTDEAAAQGSKARFKAPSVFLLSYDDLLWRALLILHGLFGTEVSVLVPPGDVGLGWELCVDARSTYRRTLVVVLWLAILLWRITLLGVAVTDLVSPLFHTPPYLQLEPSGQ